MAGDLEHWLADEPVSAWREPWTARIRRWSRRHRAVVLGAAVLLGMAVVASTAGLHVGLEKALDAQSNANKAERRAWQAWTKSFFPT
jgi:hypothetical protein